MYVCVPHVCVVPKEAKGWHRSPGMGGTCSCESIVWELGTKPKSSAHVPNY